MKQKTFLDLLIHFKDDEALNVQLQYERMKALKIDKKHTAKGKSLSKVLIRAFLWDRSVHGFCFWVEIYRVLISKNL